MGTGSGRKASHDIDSPRDYLKANYMSRWWCRAALTLTSADLRSRSSCAVVRDGERINGGVCCGLWGLGFQLDFGTRRHLRKEHLQKSTQFHVPVCSDELEANKALHLYWSWAS